MESPKEPTPDINRTQERLNQVQNLSVEFGSLSKIPEEMLSEIGYLRLTNEDGTTEVIPKERLEQRKNKPSKEELMPFGEIEVHLMTSGEKYRSIHKKEVERILSERLDSLIEAMLRGDPFEIFEEDALSNTRHLLEEALNAFYKKHQLEPDLYKEKGEIFKALPVVIPQMNLPSWSSDVDFDYTDREGEISPADAEKFCQKLNEIQGKYADITELSKNFQSTLDEKRDEVNPVFGDNPQNEEIFDHYNIVTQQDLYKLLFVQFLESEGLDECAEAVRDSQALSVLGDSLYELDKSNPSLEREKELKVKIRHATVEEKKEFSKELKEIEVAKKRRTQIKQGLIDFCNLPKIASQDIRTRIKKCKDFLSYTEAETQNATIYLDATPNSKLDENPGKISGDCTEGKPLAFRDPNIPVYNVKVFDSQKKHIGNIYLLITKTNEENEQAPKKVWHLDAIQIPNSRVDWTKSGKMLFDRLGEEAKKQDTEYITCNDESHLISNYDFIGENILENAIDECEIVIPPVNKDTYSNFQGAGNAVIVWQNRQKTTREV